LAAGEWRAASELIMNVVAPRLLVDDQGVQLHALLARFFAGDGGTGTTGAVGAAAAAVAAASSGNKALWAYMEIVRCLQRGEMSMEGFSRVEEELVAILPSLAQGGRGGGGRVGGGGDRNSCFAWRGDMLGPEEAGCVRDMYAEGGRERGEEDLVPPPLHAIRNAVMTDMIKKIFWLNRAQEAGREGGREGEGGGSVFPRSQVCRLGEMCQDYALQQVGFLTTDFIAGGVDGGGVF